ncbi:MAG: FAD-dependent oxidoreductase [Ardenticatenaceae bacterium]
MKKAVVVGGGISGILSAYLLKDKVDEVYLIEKQSTLGGLLRSFTNETGLSFDYGTHFVLSTGLPELDALLFEEMHPESWYTFRESLKEGHYFNGCFYERSGCIDATTLSKDMFAKGITELLNLRQSNLSQENLQDYLENLYGKTFTQYIYQPIYKKLTGYDLTRLNWKIHNNFHIKRLIITKNSFISNELKKSKFFDERIAYSSFMDGSSKTIKYYSKTKGVGLWVQNFASKIAQQQVKILTNRFVRQIKHENGTVKAVVLNNGEVINCDTLVWTIPIALFLRAAKVNFPIHKPKTKTVILIHLTFDAAIQTDLHWVSCYDPSFKSYRITLYPNITTETVKKPPHHLTVEVLSDGPDFEDNLVSTVKRELFEIGLLPKNAKSIYEKVQILNNAIPILTNDFVDSSQAQEKFVQEHFPSVIFTRHIGTSHMIGLLRESYRKIMDL